MIKTSGLYNDHLTVDAAITLASQKAGIEPPMMDGQHNYTCFNILNNLFDGWSNDGVNLWTRQRFMQNLVYGQAYYQLQESIMNLMELTVASITRVFGASNGTAFSLNGVAANAFDGNTATVCTCTAVGDTDPYIGFYFSETIPQSIKYIGIQSSTNSEYTISVQYSFDGSLYFDAITEDTNDYIAGQIGWLCNSCPIAAPYWRIVETTGATLAIEELYFSIDNLSKLMGAVSNGTYEAYANKNSASDPSSYTLYRDIKPKVAVYPVPTLATYQYLIYTAQVYIQVINSLYQVFYLPQRYNAAIISNLAYNLALINNPEKAPGLKMEADASYMAARMEDSEKVPLEITFEYVR